MPAGRPFGTFAVNIEDLQDEIDKYFAGQDAAGKPYTMTGLALALNVTPQTLANYGKEGYADDPKYFDAISRARLRCVSYLEERADSKDGVQGAKFMLVNNSARMGGPAYSDKFDYSVSADVQSPDADGLKAQVKDLLSELSPEEKAKLDLG